MIKHKCPECGSVGVNVDHWDMVIECQNPECEAVTPFRAGGLAAFVA